MGILRSARDELEKLAMDVRPKLDHPYLFTSEQELVEALITLNRYSLAGLRALDDVLAGEEIVALHPSKHFMRLYRKDSVSCEP